MAKLPMLVGEWEGSTADDVFQVFRSGYQSKTPEDYEPDCAILFAYLWSGGYEESAFVIYLDKDRNLMCSESSHCSCYGFEGQFEGSPTTEKALRMQAGSTYDKALGAHLKHFLDQYYPESP